jgi:hypothetical protein
MPAERQFLVVAEENKDVERGMLFETSYSRNSWSR